MATGLLRIISAHRTFRLYLTSARRFLCQTISRADIVFQCTVTSVLPEAIEMVRPDGRVVSIWIGGALAALSPTMFKQVRINIVVMAEPRDFYQAIDFLATRRMCFNFDRIISGTYTLDQTTEALRKMASFEEVKPLILLRLAS